MAVHANVVRGDGADAELLLVHRAYVLRLCRILLRGADESEDAAQQTLLKAHRALADGVRPIDGRAWLAAIARNECRSRLRRAVERTESPLPDGLPAAEADTFELVARRDLLARIREELTQLPDRQRRAVLLREFRGLSYDELATELAETVPAVESLLGRARRRLASRLVPAALALDWARKLFARMTPGPAASEAAVAGSGAAIVAKLAAAGVVAVGVSVGGSDPQGPTPAPSAASPVPRAAQERAPSVSPSGSTARQTVVAAPRREHERHVPLTRLSGSHEQTSRGREDVNRGASPSAGPGPAEPTSGRDPDPAPEAPGPTSSAPTSSDPTSSAPTSSAPTSSGSTSSGPGPGTAEVQSGTVESGHDGAASPAEVAAMDAAVVGVSDDHSGPGGSSSGSDDAATVSSSSGRGGSGSSGSSESSGSGK